MVEGLNDSDNWCGTVKRYTVPNRIQKQISSSVNLMEWEVAQAMVFLSATITSMSTLQEPQNAVLNCCGQLGDAGGLGWSPVCGI